MQVSDAVEQHLPRLYLAIAFSSSRSNSSPWLPSFASSVAVA